MFEVTDDKLIRIEKVNDCPGMYKLNEVVITKDEFIACYEKWIMKGGVANGA